MLKRRNNKAIAIVMAFVFCLTFLAPALMAPQTAAAASTYSALSTPVLTANSLAPQNLGIIQVDIPSSAAVAAGDVLTVSLPSEVTMTAAGAAVLTAGAAPAGVNGTGVEVFIPAAIGGAANGLTATAVGATAVVTATKTSLDITFGAAGTTDPGRLLIYITGATVGAVDGDVTARMLAPANSAFASGAVVVARATGTSGSTVASVLSVKTIGTAGGACDIISVTETAPNTLKAGEVIKVKLPAGYTWGAGAGTQSWGWAGVAPTVLVDPADARILNVTVNGAGFPSVVGGLSGRVNFAAGIVVDDAVAKTGDITARIYSKNGAVTESDLLIAKYGTYGVKVSEGTKTDLVAGKFDQKIGEFYIAEDLAGSLINGRSIKMTLPKGVKWSGSYSPLGATVLPATPAAESGTATLGAYAIADTNTTLKTIVTAGTKSKFKFKDLKVDISPDFVGPIKITISGDASAAGEIVVANVKPAVEITSENVKDVKIGEQNQELGTIILKETVKENIALNSAVIDTWDSAATIAAAAGTITLTLPAGADWSAGFPTVEVTEGDLQLKTNSMTKAGAVLTIPVKSSSTKPSTIKISGLKATLYRTVPEGKFEVSVAGTAINETGGTGYAFAQFEDNSAVVANCVTPAPAEGTNGAAAGQFRIDSNIYEVNGVAKVMDAAPYIKAGRTYVPVRYLGLALGVAESDIVWDATSQKVTITKGDKKVEMTIGSSTITVNGEAKTMEVAPEITSGRTMLPARYVAEGLGYVVGWDPATRTVLISK